MNSTSVSARDTKAAMVAASSATAGNEVAQGGMRPRFAANCFKVMVIDDEPTMTVIIRKHLSTKGYEDFVLINDPAQAVPRMLRETPDIVLLDLQMPNITGFDILVAMQAHPALKAIPVLVMTANSEPSVRMRAFDLGATDFLNKPIEVVELADRLRESLTLKTKFESERYYAQSAAPPTATQGSGHASVNALDDMPGANVFGTHDSQQCFRISEYAWLIGQQLGFDEPTLEIMRRATRFYDIGKLFISDVVLQNSCPLANNTVVFAQRQSSFLKSITDKLPRADAERLRNHFMASVNGEIDPPVAKLAETIARTYHEHWDGSGYPCGLQGEEIPIEGRIVAVSEIFDALSMARPYKPALVPDRCFEIMETGRGTRFDPHVLDAFAARQEDVARLLQALSTT